MSTLTPTFDHDLGLYVSGPVISQTTGLQFTAQFAMAPGGAMFMQRLMPDGSWAFCDGEYVKGKIYTCRSKNLAIGDSVRVLTRVEPVSVTYNEIGYGGGGGGGEDYDQSRFDFSRLTAAQQQKLAELIKDNTDWSDERNAPDIFTEIEDVDD